MATRQIKHINNVRENGIVQTIRGSFAHRVYSANALIDFTGVDPTTSLYSKDAQGVDYLTDFSNVDGGNRFTFQNIGATDGVWIDLDSLGALSGADGVLFLTNGSTATLTIDTNITVRITFVTPGTGIVSVFAEF